MLSFSILTMQGGVCLILLMWVILLIHWHCWSRVKLDICKHLVPEAVLTKHCTEITESMRGGNLATNWTVTCREDHLRRIIWGNTQISCDSWRWELVSLLALSTRFFWIGLWQKEVNREVCQVLLTWLQGKSLSSFLPTKFVHTHSNFCHWVEVLLVHCGTLDSVVENALSISKANFWNVHPETFVSERGLRTYSVYSDLFVMSPYWLLQASVRLSSCICHSDLINFNFRWRYLWMLCKPLMRKNIELSLLVH